MHRLLFAKSRRPILPSTASIDSTSSLPVARESLTPSSASTQSEPSLTTAKRPLLCPQQGTSISASELWQRISACQASKQHAAAQRGQEEPACQPQPSTRGNRCGCVSAIEFVILIVVKAYSRESPRRPGKLISRPRRQQQQQPYRRQ